MELSQSRAEQQDYLKNVELARVLDKRAVKKREKGEEVELRNDRSHRKRPIEKSSEPPKKKVKTDDGGLDRVLTSIF